MRWFLDIVGAILALIGVVWFLQGTNVLPVGFMAGQMQFALLGIIAVLVGIALIAYANRRQRHTPSAS